MDLAMPDLKHSKPSIDKSTPHLSSNRNLLQKYYENSVEYIGKRLSPVIIFYSPAQSTSTCSSVRILLVVQTVEHFGILQSNGSRRRKRNFSWEERGWLLNGTLHGYRINLNLHNRIESPVRIGGSSFQWNSTVISNAIVRGILARRTE